MLLSCHIPSQEVMILFHQGEYHVLSSHPEIGGLTVIHMLKPMDNSKGTL